MADGALVDRGYRTDPFLNPIPVFEPAPHEVGVATAACLWIPRQAWDAVGGFPSWFESVAEDIFFCVAARSLGHRVFVLDDPGFDHWVGKHLGGGKLVDGGLQTTVRRRALSERNKTFAMLCCYPMLVLVLLMPVHMLLLACEALFLSITGTGFTKIRRIYGGIPIAIWKHRRNIRALRKRLMHQRHDALRSLFAFTSWFPHKLRMLARHGRPHVQ
jgi:GT2 family glycosyltransferase